MFTKNQKSLMVRFALVLVLLMGMFEVVPVQAIGTTYFVKWDTTGTNNGSSWVNAYTDLQSALSAASNGDEIWVAAGTYKPTPGVDRNISFTLKNGVAVYGGFNGTELSRTQRNSKTNVTTLSGDIGTVGITTDNSYHVVVGSNTNSATILDGFTITGGYADYPSASGGGLYNYLGSPTLSNLIFKENSAVFGGGMYSEGESSGYSIARPTLTNVSFVNNNGRGEGGGMENRQYSQPTLTDVVFIGNTSNRSGGGMLNLNYCDATLTNVNFSNNTSFGGGGLSNIGSNSTLTNVIFNNNSAVEWAGGMDNAGNGNTTLTNVTFNSNISGTDGGAVSNHSYSTLALTNVTFSGNSAGTVGGAISNYVNANITLTNVTIEGNLAATYGDGIYNESGSNASIRNSILFGDGEEEIHGLVTVIYSIVQGGYAGTGNLNVDPLLMPLADNGGFTQTMALSSDSPAIDAGDDSVCPATDQRGVKRPQGRHCDIGAYEEIASKHPVMKSHAVYLSSLTTQLGTTSGSLPSLSLLDQSGADDNPAAYISFQTPDTVYLGYQSFILPVDAHDKLISNMLLQVNFKGPVSSTQAWIWSIYDWDTEMWIKLGDSMGIVPDYWEVLLFKIPNPGRYVSSGNEIRIQLRSNNAHGDAKIDYEGLHITYLSLPVTSTPIAPPAVPKQPWSFPTASP